MMAPDDLVTAAAMVEAELPDVAALLRRQARMVETSDPRLPRRIALRRIHRRFYPGMARTTAARMIEAAWAAWSRGARGEALPGSIEGEFLRLEGAGIRPIRCRRIADDLDVDFD